MSERPRGKDPVGFASPAAGNFFPKIIQARGWPLEENTGPLEGTAAK
jgi:hypothetical protein